MSKPNRLREACSLYESLKSEWDKPARARSLQLCTQLLSNIKLLMTDLNFIPSAGDATDQECLLARSVLELACFIDIESGNAESFERHLAELKPYYLDLSDVLTESPYCHHILGLDLLYLLAQNRLADFHADLELLPRSMLTSPYIRYPVKMEQFLMEGCYNKIFLARDNVPADNYTFFMNALVATVREEIASSLQKAYDQLTLADAGRLLFITSAKETKDFIENMGWHIDKNTGYLVFKGLSSTSDEVPKSDDVIPHEDIAMHCLGYARSLETII